MTEEEIGRLKQQLADVEFEKITADAACSGMRELIQEHLGELKTLASAHPELEELPRLIAKLADGVGV